MVATCEAAEDARARMTMETRRCVSMVGSLDGGVDLRRDYLDEDASSSVEVLK